MRKVTLSLTADGSGNATTNSTQNILGIVHAILYKPGTIATGATLTVTSQGVFAKPLLTKASAGTSDTMFYPRDFEHAVADGAASTTNTTLPLVNGNLRAVIASGGAGGAGTVIVYYLD